MGSVAGPGESLAATLAVQYQSAMHNAMPSLPPSLPTFGALPPHHHGLPHGHHVLASEDTETEANVGASTASIGGDGESSYTPSVPLYCLCQQPYDGTSFMLACDNCNKWYHGKCVGVPEEEAKRGQRNGYTCPSCAKSTPGSEVLRSMSLDVEDHDDASIPSVHITGEKRPREEAESLDTDHDGSDLLHSSGTAEGDLGGLGMAGAGAEEGEPAKKRRKSQMHQRGERLCRFPGCDKKISCRSYCSRHQKQKERCSKRGTIFSTSSSPRKSGSIGRPSKTFSQTRNQRQKLKRFDDKINDFAGGEQEGTAMLERYLNSSYGQKRLPSAKGDKTSQRIGQNAIQLVNQLPPTSPLRKPLIKALGQVCPSTSWAKNDECTHDGDTVQGLSQSEIADTFHVSRKTVERSFALSAEDNLLFSLVSRPRGSKPKEATDGALDVQQQEQLAQAGIYQTVRLPALSASRYLDGSITQYRCANSLPCRAQSSNSNLPSAMPHCLPPSPSRYLRDMRSCGCLMVNVTLIFLRTTGERAAHSIHAADVRGRRWRSGWCGVELHTDASPPSEQRVGDAGHRRRGRAAARLPEHDQLNHVLFEYNHHLQPEGPPFFENENGKRSLLSGKVVQLGVLLAQVLKEVRRVERFARDGLAQFISGGEQAALPVDLLAQPCLRCTTGIPLSSALYKERR